MATDPAAGLFPETLVAPFVEAPDVAELADEVLAEFDEFEPIRTAIAEGELRITYVFETKVFDQNTEELKPHTIAKVTKASPLWRSLAETELVIQVRQWFWDRFDATGRRRTLHHELSHIRIDEGGKLSLREHDLEDFRATVRRFGPRPWHQGFFKAYADWSHEQDHPEPTPLRKVDGRIVDPETGEVLDHGEDGEA
jgi:hypothetical protein